MTSGSELAAAKALLEGSGFVVIKTGSYRRAQERQRIAECALRYETERREGVERWARDCCEAERRLHDRCNALVGFAYEHGATVGDLVAFNARLDAVAADSDRGVTP